MDYILCGIFALTTLVWFIRRQMALHRPEKTFDEIFCAVPLVIFLPVLAGFVGYWVEQGYFVFLQLVYVPDIYGGFLDHAEALLGFGLVYLSAICMCVWAGITAVQRMLHF